MDKCQTRRFPGGHVYLDRIFFSLCRFFSDFSSLSKLFWCLVDGSNTAEREKERERAAWKIGVGFASWVANRMTMATGYLALVPFRGYGQHRWSSAFTALWDEAVIYLRLFAADSVLFKLCSMIHVLCFAIPSNKLCRSNPLCQRYPLLFYKYKLSWLVVFPWDNAIVGRRWSLRRLCFSKWWL